MKIFKENILRKWPDHADSCQVKYNFFYGQKDIFKTNFSEDKMKEKQLLQTGKEKHRLFSFKNKGNIKIINIKHFEF